jgi:hypothetical protein
MKRLLIASLSTLVLTAVPVYAQEMTANNQKLDRIDNIQRFSY